MREPVKSSQATVDTGRLPGAERLSVIMCNYNDSASIAEALAAVCEQSWAPDEVIVVDDGSTDNSVDVIKRCISRYPMIRLIEKERNEGILKAVNTGVNAATGDVLGFASANDLIYPGFLQCGMRVLAKHPGAGIFCGDMHIHVEDGSGVEDIYLANRLPRAGYYSPEEFAASLQGETICSPTVLVRRHTFGEELYPEAFKWHSDWWSFTLIGLKYGVCYEKFVCVKFNTNRKSWSNCMFDPSMQRPVFLATLNSALANRSLLRRIVRAKVFNLFIYGCDVVDFEALTSFLIQTRFSPRALYLICHLVYEKVKFYSKIYGGWVYSQWQAFRGSAKAAYYWGKGRLIDVQAFAYRAYVRTYQRFSSFRNRLK